MARYYLSTADMLYEDKETPDAIFANLIEELKNTIPAEAKDNAYYHITQFNNVT